MRSVPKTTFSGEPFGWWAGLLLAVLAGLLLVPATGHAQRASQLEQARPQLPTSYGVELSPELKAKMRTDYSPFTISGSADLAKIGMRARGSMIHNMTNDGPSDYYFVLGGSQWSQLGTPTGFAQMHFMGPILAGAPKSEWEEHRQQVSSLNNATGEGFTSRWNLNAWFLRFPNDWRAADGQLGSVHSGATVSDDGTCTDFTGDDVDVGAPLAAASDCPDTWGSEQFQGAANRITFDGWQQYFNSAGAENFDWDWWHVPDEFVSDQNLGDFQTYAKIQDWTSDVLARFGSVIPGQSGEPTDPGWPLGLTIKYDAFSFELPDVANTTYWRALIINESEKVYGVPLSYDSLYFGVQHGWLMNIQNAAVYYRPELGGLLANNNGTNPACNDARVPSGVAGCSFGSSSAGFGNGAAAMLVLNSPLGDLRNKLFTQEGSPFFAPNHPNAGDTITFNHGRTCGFGSCWNFVPATSPRADVGYMSGNAEWMFDGRPASAFSASSWYGVFRNHDFPTRTPEINQWVPGNWDWNHDGVQDTLTIHSCLGEEFGGPPGGGCSEPWSDTLPGRLNNGASNFGGWIGAGPFPLAAGDTTKFTMAYVTGPSRASIESNVRNALGFYQRSFLGPKAPAPPNVVSVSTRPGDRGRPQGARVQLFIDDAIEDFEDVFLNLQANQFEGTQLAEDNPFLLDTIRAVAGNNVKAIHVFKSCTDGETFTADNDCLGDPAEDLQGEDVALGWQPFATLEPDDDGRFPNVFTDNAVTPGKTYLYSFIAETHGLEGLNVVARNDAGEPIPQTLDLAPPLFNPLSTNTGDQSVISVYVPASRQAGGRSADVTFTEEDPETPTEFHDVEVSLTGTIPSDLEGNRLIFGDSVVVTEVEQDGSVNTTVRLHRTVTTSPDGASLERTVVDTREFTTGDPAGVDVNGGETTVTEEGGATVTETVYADELTMLALGPTGAPLFTSSILDGSGTTPGGFLGRQDFPRWLVEIDNSRAGDWVSTNWLLQVSPDSQAVMRSRGSPTMEWLREIVEPTGVAFGEYVFEFEGSEFGPQGLFRVNVSNPLQTQDAFQASLSQRAVAQTTDVSQEVAEAIGVDASELIEVALPFTVRQTTPDRPVTVAMMASAKRDSITLGTGTNQVTVAVPEEQWVPGESLVFLEPVERFRTATTPDGDEYVVMEGGQPATTSAPIVTWSRAVLGCEAPTTCNPVPGGTPGASGSSHLPLEPADQSLRVRYRNRIDNETSYAFTVEQTVEGSDVTDLDPQDFDDIKVVPNPYVMFSTYEQQNAQRRLMFAGLPPRGTVEVYTVAGQFVQRITYDEDDLAGNGDLYWNMRTFENTDLASGLYIFVVDGTLPASGRSVRKVGKFVVIR